MPTERPRDKRPGSRGDSRGPSADGRPPRKDGPPRKGGRTDAPARGPRRDDERRPPGPDLAGPAKWGRIARGGAGRMESPAIGSEGNDDFPKKKKRPPREAPADAAGETPEAASGSGGGDAEPAPAEARAPRPPHERTLPTAGDLERQATKAVRRSRGPRLRERTPLGARPQRVEDPAVVLKRLVGAPRAKSLQRRLHDAGTAYQAERFGDARSSLQPVVKEAPELPDGRELMGLALYRLGRWREAIEQLEVFREMTHSTEQHPVLMDCHRALGRWQDVDVLWAELGDASPAGELVTEGRIVLAGAQADQGDVATAIRTLETGWKLPRRPETHHLRRAYALADLYDRAGKAARARELFTWISGQDPRFGDVRSRVKALS